MTINTDLRKLLVGHKGKWVALSADNKRVVGSANTPKGALEQARINKEKNPVLTGEPEDNSAFIL